MQIYNNVHLPAGTPSQAGTAATSVSDAVTKKVKAVDVKLTIGIMESLRKASYQQFEAKVLACRLPELNVRASVVPTRSVWLPHS
jgi:hypothetical protein